MSRLIDVDELKKGISEKTRTDREASRLIDIIDAQPTAYDVDKVVERIYNLFPLQTTAGEFVSKNDVTNLVKGGGVDE